MRRCVVVLTVWATGLAWGLVALAPVSASVQVPSTVAGVSSAGGLAKQDRGDPGSHDRWWHDMSEGRQRWQGTAPKSLPSKVSKLLQPNQTATISLAGYSLTVPAGTLKAPALASISLVTDAADGLGSGAQFNLGAGHWNDTGKTVSVTVPAPPDLALLGAAWIPAVVHLPQGGAPEILVGSDVWVNPSSGGLTVQAHSLSPFFGFVLPQLSPDTLISFSSWTYMQKLVSQWDGLTADRPTCSPDITTTGATKTTGDPFTKPALSPTPLLYCVQQDGGGAQWKLANNSGTVLTLTVSGATIGGTQSSGDEFLTHYFAVVDNAFAQRTVYLPPGEAVLVNLPGTGNSNGNSAQVQVGQQLAEVPVYLGLREIGTAVAPLGVDVFTPIIDVLKNCHFSAKTDSKQLITESRCAIGKFNALTTALTLSKKTPQLLKAAKAATDALAMVTLASDALTSLFDAASQSLGSGPGTLTLVGAPAPPPPPALGTITGVVTDAGGTHHGLAHVWVAVASQTTPDGPGGSTTTSANGTYSVAGLPAGSYTACFYPDGGNIAPPNTATGGSSDARGYINQCYNGKATGSLPTQIVVTAGATRTGINAAVADAGSISGVVTDAGGTHHGLANVDVVVSQASTWTAAGAMTAADGSYTVNYLPAGTSYQICFSPSSATGVTGGSAGPHGYLAQCYNMQPASGTPTPVTVTANATKTGIGAALVRAP